MMELEKGQKGVNKMNKMGWSFCPRREGYNNWDCLAWKIRGLKGGQDRRVQNYAWCGECGEGDLFLPLSKYLEPNEVLSHEADGWEIQDK